MPSNKINLKRILLIYKKSAHEIYFLRRKSSLFKRKGNLTRAQLSRFKNAHNEHYRTLKKVEAVLKRLKIKYRKCPRQKGVDYARFTFVITIGGDGTFLQTARNLKRQTILGVNSDPQNSRGEFCAADAKSFEAVFKKILAGKIKVKSYNRLKLKLSSRRKEINVLNDILVCHQNPAAMSRYVLKIGRIFEEQRSSGLWVATAVGSSGAIKSAGGKVLGKDQRAVQYKPRELYHSHHRRYRLKGGVLPLSRVVWVTSLMRDGVVFVDGAHFCISFPMGDVIRVARSNEALQVIRGKK